MHRHFSLLLCIVCLTLGPGVGLADELSTENVVAGTNAAVINRRSLTLEQAIQDALANNRELAAARVRVEEAKARLQQAGLWPNPELELDGRFDNTFNNEGERSFGAAFNQPFSVSGRLGAQRRLARTSIERTIAEVRDQERHTAAAVRTEFTELFAIEEQIKLQTFLIELNAKLLTAIQAAFGRGEVSEKDVNAILIARQQAEQRLKLLGTQRRGRLLQLDKLMGKPPEHEFVAAGELKAQPQPDPSGFTLKRALERRPDYAAAQLDVSIARAERELTKAERYEDWRVGAGYEHEQTVVDGAPPQRAGQFLGLRLTVPLPLFDRKQGRIRETLATEDRAGKLAEALQIQIAQELADALNRVTSLAPLLESYQGGLLKRAEDNVKLVEDGYRKGLVSVAEVIQSRQQFNELKSSYIDTLRDYHLALVDLDIAAGVFPSKER